MNSKVLLAVVVVLTLVTAGIHLSLGGSRLARMGSGSGGQPPANTQPQSGGQAQPGGGQPSGGGLRSIIGPNLPYLFVLNGIGYLALLALIVFQVPYFRDHPALSHWLLIGFAALTLVLYFAMNNLEAMMRNPNAIAAKSAELLLVIFAFLHLRSIQSSAAPAAATAPTEA